MARPRGCCGQQRVNKLELYLARARRRVGEVRFGRGISAAPSRRARPPRASHPPAWYGTPRMGLPPALTLGLLLLASPAARADEEPNGTKPNHTSPVWPPPLPAPLPTPPRQTAVQLTLITEVQRKAPAASDAARPGLLELLASSDFSAALGGCCPELLAMTPAARLAWFDTEHKSIEMVHNFGRGPVGDVESDEAVMLGANSTYFHNLWEIELLQAELPSSDPPPPPPPNSTHHCAEQSSVQACENITADVNLTGYGRDPPCKWVDEQKHCVNLTSSRSGRSGRQTTDVVEVGLYGFPPFSNKTAADGEAAGSYTFAEAVQRPIYTACESYSQHLSMKHETKHEMKR